MVRKKCKKLMNDQNFEEGKFMDFFGVLTMLGGWSPNYIEPVKESYGKEGMP